MGMPTAEEDPERTWAAWAMEHYRTESLWKWKHSTSQKNRNKMSIGQHYRALNHSQSWEQDKNLDMEVLQTELDGGKLRYVIFLPLFGSKEFLFHSHWFFSTGVVLLPKFFVQSSSQAARPVSVTYTVFSCFQSKHQICSGEFCSSVGSSLS